MGASMSAEDIKKMISGNTTERYLGDYGGHSPMLDLVMRLSGDLNQQNAEGNLYRGGEGYGGSFQSEAQKAYQAAGLKPPGATPYGGSGGYGSGNPTMNYGAPGMTPVHPPVSYPAPQPEPYPQPADPYGDPAGDPGGVGTAPAPPRTPSGTPPVANPPTRSPGSYEPPVRQPTRQPWVPEQQPTQPYYPPRKAMPGQEMQTTAATPAKLSENQEAALQLAAKRHKWSPAEIAYQREKAAGRPADQTSAEYIKYANQGSIESLQRAGRNDEANALKAKVSSPEYKGYLEIQDYLNKKGDVQGVREPDVIAALQSGATVADLKKHFGTILDAGGPRAFHTNHTIGGQINDFSPEGIARLKSGELTKAALTNITGSSYTPPSGGNTTPPRKGTTSSGKAAPGMTANSVTDQPEEVTDADGTVWLIDKDGNRILKPAPGGVGGGNTGGSGQPAPLPEGEGGGRRDPNNPPRGSSGGGGGGTTGGGNGGPPNQPSGPPSTYDITKPTTFDPNAGKNWGAQSTPPKGAQPGDYWQLPDGRTQTLGYSGTYHNMDFNPKTGTYQMNMGNGTYNTNDALHDIPTLNTPDHWDEEPYEANPKTPGGNMPTQVGQGGVIGYDSAGNPIYNDNFMFEQGDNASGAGDYTPDAWSTATPWRPEEPTGGVYDAYKTLASGQLTDYENDIGGKWKSLAENPVTPQDLEYQRLLAEYNKSPGKGVDEAYGAYNKMLAGNGYSDAEKGAIAGSAVRGASQAFQRSADELRRQAARTGNATSAYAALGNAGSQYGQGIGEMNRQNQIKFADEAQRRQEAGAAGMTNVAGISNTRSQFGLGAQQNYANELARRKEAATKGMGDYATFGRGLQSQGLQGMQKLLDSSTAQKNNTYALIAQLLGNKTGQFSSGTSDQSSTGWSVNTG